MIGSTHQWRSYADFFKASSYSAFPQEHRSSPGRLRFRMILAEMEAHNYTDPEVPDLIVSLPIDVPKDSFWSWNLGDGWCHDRLTAGRMTVMPPHTSSQWDVEGRRRNLVLLVPTQTIERIIGTASPPNLTDAFAPLSRSAWEDSFLQTMIVRLWEVAQHAQLMDSRLADGLLTAITSQLLQRAGTVGERPDRLALSPTHLRRVTAYVDENLDQAIEVADMAAVTGLSERHFARAFRLETGETPHGWLMSKRIDRAKQMLLTSDMECGLIGKACGFASQSHFTVAMRKATGSAPHRWRKSHQ